MQGGRDAGVVGIQRRPPAHWVAEVTAGLGFVKGTGMIEQRKGVDRSLEAEGGASAKSGQCVTADTLN